MRNVRRLFTLLAMVLLMGSPSAYAQRPIHLILVHGLWALPESLHELGEHLAALGYDVNFIAYNNPKTCDELGDAVKEQFGRILESKHIDPERTYAYGYSLGAMGIALANLGVKGIILDAPANYSALACRDLEPYEPNGTNYELGTLHWRWTSDNRSPAVDMFTISKAHVLIIGHRDDALIPQATLFAYARARHAAVDWVPGDHTPVWPAVALSIQHFVQMWEKFPLTAEK